MSYLEITPQVKKYRARDFLRFDTERLKNLYGQFDIVLDDGYVQRVDQRDIQYNAFVWEFHRRYGLPIIRRHTLKEHLNGPWYRDITSILLVGAVMFDTIDFINPANDKKEAFLNDVQKLSYRVINEIYNHFSIETLPWCASITIEHFHDLYTCAVFRKAVHSPVNTQVDLVNKYEAMRTIIRSERALDENPLVMAARAGLLKMDQLLQCFVRGLPTDLDSHAFAKPILTGYYTQIRTLNDSGAESRSAAKALAFTQEPLQRTEYWNRRTQFIACAVQRIHRGDCGTDRTITRLMRPKRTENGIKHRGDLEKFAGTYFVTETGELDLVSADRKDLEGKYLKLRSVLAGCGVRDPNGCCEVCFGEQATALFSTTNVGYACSIHITGPTGQQVLSVKHLDGSAQVSGIVIRGGDGKYVRVDTSGFNYMLQPELFARGRISLSVPAASVPGLAALIDKAQVRSIDITDVSEVEELGLNIAMDDGFITDNIEVMSARRRSSFSREFLAFAIDKGWQVLVDPKMGETYVFDMTGWNPNTPLMVLPKRHINIGDHQATVASMLESSMRDLQQRATTIKPESLAIELLDLINERMYITWPVLAMLVYTTMSIDVMGGDVRFPKAWTTGQLGAMRRSMMRRSLSPWLAFEHHRTLFTNPGTYLRKRPDNPLDVIVDPAGYFRAHPEEQRTHHEYMDI